MATRVRIEPYFRVVDLDDPDQPYFFGPTARAALTDAKQELGPLLVTNGHLIEATSWGAPIYPDDSDLLEQVARITGGVVLD